MDREALKERIRAEMTPYMERIIEEKQAELRSKGQEVSPRTFLLALRQYYPSAEAQWRRDNAGIELDEPYIALRREVYLEIVDTLLRRATN